jgi:hypothetical protein
MIFRTENGRADNINRSIFRKRERNTPLHPSQEGIKKSRNDRGKDYRKAEEIRLYL